MNAPNVGLIGCGRWGQYILRDLKLLGAQVTVVARTPESRGRAEAHGAYAIVPDVSQLPHIDAVYIASLVGTHAEVIASVVDRGIPIFCEKPLTNSAVAADRLVQRAGDRLFVLDKWRYHPGVEALGHIARSGELGDIIGLQTRRIGWGNPHADSSPPWVLAPHDLSIGLEVLGRVLPLKSSAVDGKNGRLSGVSALLGDDQAWQYIEISSRSPERVRSVRLLCTQGCAALNDPFADHVEVYGIEAGEDERPLAIERRTVSTEWPLKRMLNATLEYLRGGPPPRTPAADGALIVRRIEQMLAH